MIRTGYAELPLHHGHVPQWLAERMAKLGFAITAEIIAHKGKHDFLERMSDPFWLQSLGAVMGMDWHSSGVTTSVMGALRRSINPHAKEFGIYISGGKGKASRETPQQLAKYAEQNGLDSDELIRSSKLSAKVDNTAVQDGFQLYQHHFIVNNEGQWTVIQQGMSNANATARRYHWHSSKLKSFTEDPHTFIYGENQGKILNMTAQQAQPLKQAMLSLTSEAPEKIIAEVKSLKLPSHHDIRSSQVDIKRLGTILWLAHENEVKNFEELLLLEGLGPRTLQSLALVSEVIHGSPTRFSDPARFSFAHGGKDGHPFPVPIKIYDETLNILHQAIHRSKLGNTEKSHAIKSLSKICKLAEQDFVSKGNLDDLIQKERNDSWKYGGMTVFGKAKPPHAKQLSLF